MILVDHQNMPIAFTLSTAFNGRIRRHRIGTGIAFIRILKAHRNLGLIAWYHDKRNAQGRACAEVRVKRFGCADGLDVCRGIGIHWKPVNGRIPNIVGRQNRASGD